ncbi:hypothetical protein FRAHR75_1130009 [Frankia sp. Hr75.2]|nr:hypothetical protein FRAHR75_1130009 [Frankia sp. Hr75.2]
MFIPAERLLATGSIDRWDSAVRGIPVGCQKSAWARELG